MISPNVLNYIEFVEDLPPNYGIIGSLGMELLHIHLSKDLEIGYY